MEPLWHIFVENRKQHYTDDRFFIEQKDETRESKEDHVWDSYGTRGLKRPRVSDRW